MGPQRLQHRLRGLADPLRAAHRPGRSPTVVRGRRRPVHRRVRGVRIRAVRRAADPGPGLPGLRRRDARAGLAGPGHRGLPAGAARPRHRRVGGVRRRGRGRRAADRWRPGAARRLALGLPRQPALRPGRGVGGSPPARREPGPRPARHARPRRRGPPRRQPGPAQPRHHQGWRLGVDQPPGARLLRRCRDRAGAVRGELEATPDTHARPDPAAPALVRPRFCRNGGSGLRVLRVPADQRPVAAVRLGLRRAARRPCSRARGDRGRARRGAPRSAGRALRLPRVRRPRGDRVGGRLPLVPPAGRAPAGVLGRVDARSDPQRHRGRCDPAPARQRDTRRGPRRAVRHGIRGGLECAPARGRPRHRDPRGHHR